MKSEPLPLRIEKPCSKQWDDLTGGTTKRFCGHCQLHVHNLSAMHAREREQFISASGGRSCIAYELRPDGSMVTPSRWAWLLFPFQRVPYSIAALLAAILPLCFSACATRRTLGKPSRTSDVFTESKSGEPHNVVFVGTPMLPPAPARQ